MLIVTLSAFKGEVVPNPICVPSGVLRTDVVGTVGETDWSVTCTRDEVVVDCSMYLPILALSMGIWEVVSNSACVFRNASRGLDIGNGVDADVSVIRGTDELVADWSLYLLVPGLSVLNWDVDPLSIFVSTDMFGNGVVKTSSIYWSVFIIAAPVEVVDRTLESTETLKPEISNYMSKPQLVKSNNPQTNLTRRTHAIPIKPAKVNVLLCSALMLCLSGMFLRKAHLI